MYMPRDPVSLWFLGFLVWFKIGVWTTYRRSGSLADTLFPVIPGPRPYRTISLMLVPSMDLFDLSDVGL